MPVSASAVLEIVSGHRLPRSVDGVLLMAETLILGPGPQAHVTMPDLKQPVILFRHKDGLGLRHAGPLTVNGQRVHGALRAPARIARPSVCRTRTHDC